MTIMARQDLGSGKIKKESLKLQASSFKLDNDRRIVQDVIGQTKAGEHVWRYHVKYRVASLTKKGKNMDKEIKDRSINPLIRIADALEEILRLVKKDMEPREKKN